MSVSMKEDGKSFRPHHLIKYLLLFIPVLNSESLAENFYNILLYQDSRIGIIP